jgi:hypothetical protein
MKINFKSRRYGKNRKKVKIIKGHILKTWKVNKIEKIKKGKYEENKKEATKETKKVTIYWSDQYLGYIGLCNISPLLPQIYKPRWGGEKGKAKGESRRGGGSEVRRGGGRCRCPNGGKKKRG